ncbi:MULTISPECIES: hypothetical protein [Wolbachia]|uniref:hypothetical protein n=1 Tax=Wolbachia TaxID=953 RepID=UPI00031EE1AE|nr:MULTISPECIES: hypothetical protein [Wolbachia]UYC23979.1 hypothetical protein L3551_01805 [Wolbachia endosymbiont of Aedes aegypti]QZA83118.1 hypothetical protein K1Y75_04600 [Wolbachia pipientis]UFO00639.1 hypothetical protein LOK48_01445 [Wolbachia endosymbiont of Corcyra cephalonica]BDG75757.1 hypothetical protein wHmt_03150 [Wolbachia pipientis]BDG77218.1 hypothetical protein wHmc_03500 [Wolbachia pipientis]
MRILSVPGKVDIASFFMSNGIDLSSSLDSGLGSGLSSGQGGQAGAGGQYDIIIS